MVARRETNLGYAEVTPYSHKYLLKRPRTHEHRELADRVISLHAREEEESAHIDNPLVEKSTWSRSSWMPITTTVPENFR